MGGSSRPDFNIKCANGTDFYFTQWLEKWRLAFGDLRDFILIGHSLGGYVCGQYASQYHQHIKKLVLITPLGLSSKPKTWTPEEELEKFSDSKYSQKIFMKLREYFWPTRFSPFDLVRNCNYSLSKKLIYDCVKGTYPLLSETEIIDVGEYIF